MVENPILSVYAHGQSIWYDNLRRGLLISGEIERMIRCGEISGITSNPTIFDKAISRSGDYDAVISALLAHLAGDKAPSQE